MHAACHASINLKFRRAVLRIVKFVSVIEASKLITTEVESRSQTDQAHLHDLCD